MFSNQTYLECVNFKINVLIIIVPAIIELL